MAGQDELIFDLVLETKQAVADVKSMLSKTNNSAAREGKKAGTAFGQNLKSAILGVASGISFAFLTKQVGNLFNTFRQYTESQFQLKGAIEAVNQAEQEKNRVLNDSTASIEQKAMAIGLDTNEIYENTKATKSNEGAIKDLERQITAKERALEDETRALQQNISAVEDKRDLEIRSLREQRGFNTLTKEEQGLEKEITKLELERLQAIKAGDGVEIARLNAILEQKKLDQDIAQKKLDLIDQETDKIENLYKVEIQQLRTEMEASKNKFDIDIEPAKRKLEDLRATSVSVGGGQVLKKGVLDQINQAKKEVPKLLKGSDFSALQDELFEKYEGFVPRGALGSAISDLVKSGLKETSQVEQVVSRFVDIAAAGRSPFISMGDAVSQLGEQFRSERAALGESAGLKEEYLSEILPRGIALLKAEGMAESEITDALAKKAGLLDMTSDRQGQFTKKLEEGLLSAEELRSEFNKIGLTLALFLGPKFLEVAIKLLPLAKQLTEFVQNNPEVVTAILGIVTAFTGLLGVASGLIFILPTLSAVFGAIASPIGLIVAGVLAVTGAFTALIVESVGIETIMNKLKEIWDDDVSPALDRFKTILKDTWKFLSETFQPTFDILADTFEKHLLPALTDAWDSFYDLYLLLEPYILPILKTLGFILGAKLVASIITLGLIVGGLATGFKLTFDMIRKNINTARNDWDKFTEAIKSGWDFAFKGLPIVAKTALNAVIEEINKSLTRFNDLGNGFENMTGGRINVPDMPKLPKFATGGEMMVGGPSGIDKTLVQFWASRREKVIVQTPTQQRTDNSKVNSGNTYNYYNIGGDNQFSPSF